MRVPPSPVILDSEQIHYNRDSGTLYLFSPSQLTKTLLYKLPAFPDNLNGLLDASQIKRYANNMMLPLLSLCGRDELTKLHELMSDYYVLNDEGRKQMFTMMDMLKNTYTDSERKKALKSIKK